jgi:hypothetical protein
MIRPGMRTNLDNRVSKAQGEKNVTEAKQNALQGPGANAAQQSLRQQMPKPTQVKTAPVGRLELPERQPQAPVELPTGGPVMPPPEEGFDPEVFKEDMVSNILGQIRTKQFVNSPRVKDATTSVQIKEFFNQNNPNRRQDGRSLIEQVTSRMGMK